MCTYHIISYESITFIIGFFLLNAYSQAAYAPPKCLLTCGVSRHKGFFGRNAIIHRCCRLTCVRAHLRANALASDISALKNCEAP